MNEERRPLGELAGRLTKMAVALRELGLAYADTLAEEAESIRSGIRAHRCAGVVARFGDQDDPVRRLVCGCDIEQSHHTCPESAELNEEML